MKKVYQKIVDPGRGDCMRAALCSLIGVSDENVNNFIENDYWKDICDFLDVNGFSYEGMLWNPNLRYFTHPTESCFKEVKVNDFLLLDHIKDFKGVDGLFLGSVFSPKYFSLENILATHAVIVDKDFNIVFDPNPEYQGIREYPLSRLIGYNGIRDVLEIVKV